MVAANAANTKEKASFRCGVVGEYIGGVPGGEEYGKHKATSVRKKKGEMGPNFSGGGRD